ncbi:hypothetical protein [Streptomyces cavernicola]|uniref:PASTA domain-containing protein n=1 Tax=Streptomyces cavernicola TaxID=3043613 RepID=A0ABT6SJN6_9ACTN|nr:hypothetical protein [Streptomyces sp. B-S-A6]MDI3408402.1 hypothetical protein [Streptomyces sp. B-S-A6]
MAMFPRARRAADTHTFRLLPLLLVTMIATGGCMSSSPEDDPNTRLPRMERSDALTWARDYTSYMAEITDVELINSTEKINYEECLGANGELADDGRYSLFYYVYSPAPVTEHTRVVRALRQELKKKGYEVTGYREFKDSYYAATLSARNRSNGYSVTADTVGSGKTKPQRLSFAVRTPCMLPPGVKQQQF